MADNGVGNFDVVILGAGSGGYACAMRAAQLGLSVALVEKGKLGGTCLHVGCIPTKALLHAAEVADTARESEQFGVNATLEGIDMGGVNKYKDGVVSRLFKGLTGLIKGRGITVIEGEGRLVGERTVEVNGQRYVGRAVVLASGSYSRSLPGLEVDGHRVLTSEHALTLDRVPRSAIVLGGGVIGCEFASVWRSFGADVTIVEALPRLVAAEDEDVSKTLERGFRKRKIGVRTGSPFQSVESTEDGVRVTVEGGDHLARSLGPADLQRDHRDVAGGRQLERRPESFGLANRLEEQADHAGRVQAERVLHVLADRRDDLLPGGDDQVEPDAAVVERHRRERRPRVTDEGDGPATKLVGRGEAGRAQAGLEVDEPHPVPAAERHGVLVRDRRQARRQGGPVRIGPLLEQARERRGAPRARRRSVCERRLDSSIRHAEDRQVHRLGHLADACVATVSVDLVVAWIDRVDVAVEPTAAELDHHLAAEGSLLDAGADDGDRAGPQH